MSSFRVLRMDLSKVMTATVCYIITSLELNSPDDSSGGNGERVLCVEEATVFPRA
jgi:hypothetical protein